MFLSLPPQDYGDLTVDFDQFWRFMSELGTRHAPDPAELAKDYVRAQGVSQLFETMLAAILFHKPKDPKAFLAERLVALKATGKNAFFVDKDLEVLFGTFDLTRKGSITAEQARGAPAGGERGLLKRASVPQFPSRVPCAPIPCRRTRRSACCWAPGTRRTCETTRWPDQNARR